MQPYTLRWLIPFTLVVLLLAACGDSADDSADTTQPPSDSSLTTTTLPPSSIDPATQAAVEIAEHAVDVWNDGDVAAFQALFREDGAINYLQASGTHVRDHMAFLMAIDDQLALERCQPASDDAVIECSGTNTDQLTEDAGLIADATWTFKIDNGSIVRLDWRPYSDPRKKFIEEIGNWLPTAHPEIWAETFALPSGCTLENTPDCVTGTWYETLASAAALLELAPEFIAESPVYPLTG